MNQQEMHDEQIKDKLRMKDNALRIAIEAIKKWSDGGGDECMVAIKVCEKALEA